jgi:uncharacterized Zn-finger protein
MAKNGQIFDSNVDASFADESKLKPLSNVLFGDKVKVDPKSIENQILDSIKKENHDEFEDSYNSYSPQLSELKVEFSEEGEENKVFGHEGIQNEGKPHQCSICSISFSVPAKLKEHVEAVHEGKKPHVCITCEMQFGFKKSLKAHIDKHHPEEAKVHEKKNFKRKLEKDLQSFEEKHEPKPKRNRKKFNCNQCGKSFAYEEILKRHVNGVHKKPKRPKMVKNGQMFDSNVDVSKDYYILDVTVADESKPKPKRKKNFDCDECESVFEDKEQLKAHLKKVHLNERPYQCSICKRQFSLMVKLHKHMIKLHLE